MSLKELAVSFGVMFPAFSLPVNVERSRNKERLEASLAGLYELELLKQRQECRVLSVLCLGNSAVPGCPPWGDLKETKGNALDDYGRRFQTNNLQCTPRSINASLEQQVAELKINTEAKSADSPTYLEDSRPCSGVLVAKQNRFAESYYHHMVPHSLSEPVQTGETETGETWLSDPSRQFMVSGALGKMKDADSSQEHYEQAQKVETYIFGLIQRRVLPTRPSKPRTSLAHDTRAASVVRQSSLCRKEEQHSPNQMSVIEISSPSQFSEGTALQTCNNVDQEHYRGIGFTEDAPSLYQHHLDLDVQNQRGLYHTSRQASMINTSHSTVLDCTSFRVLQAHPDSSCSEPDSPQHFHNYPSSSALSKPHQPPSPDVQLVNAEFIPARPCRASTRAYAHHHSNPYKDSGVPKANQSIYPSDKGHHQQEQQPTAFQIQPSRSRVGPKKCRSNDDRSGASRKPGKKACRSQSENSLQRVPECKYNTVERDGGSGGRGSRSNQSRSKKQQQGGGNYRRWQSTLELSQDEADKLPMQAPMQGSSCSNQKNHCVKRTRKYRPIPASYAYPHHHSHHQQQMEFQLERDHVQPCQPSEGYPHPGQGESESSMSEADSPDSSSLSSDSDESGGLVWPQQLPPQLSLPSSPAPPGAPLHPKAFVKIKASHALKKKILRFRTGSLKVMTTV